MPQDRAAQPDSGPVTRRARLGRQQGSDSGQGPKASPPEAQHPGPWSSPAHAPHHSWTPCPTLLLPPAATKARMAGAEGTTQEILACGRPVAKLDPPRSIEAVHRAGCCVATSLQMRMCNPHGDRLAHNVPRAHTLRRPASSKLSQPAEKQMVKRAAAALRAAPGPRERSVCQAACQARSSRGLAAASDPVQVCARAYRQGVDMPACTLGAPCRGAERGAAQGPLLYMHLRKLQWVEE